MWILRNPQIGGRPFSVRTILMTRKNWATNHLASFVPEEVTKIEWQVWNPCSETRAIWVKHAYEGRIDPSFIEDHAVTKAHGMKGQFVHWRTDMALNQAGDCFPRVQRCAQPPATPSARLMQVHVAIGCMTVLICSFPCWFCTGMPCVCTFLHWSVFACMHQLSCVISCFAVVHSELYTAFSSTSMVEKKWSELVWFYFEVLGIFSLLTSLQVWIFIVLVVRSILLMLLSFRCSVHFYLGIIWFSYISGY